MENEQSRATKKGDHHDDAGGGNHNHNQPSKSELLASAKVMADAARRRGENKVDKAEVAGAAANLLHAASGYGKLEDKPLGKYVEKAENHLRHYHTSHPTTTTGHSSTNHNHPGKDHSHGHTSENSGGDHHEGEGKGKYEDYIKLAEGLAEGILKKHSGGGGGGGGHSTDTSSSAHTHSGNGDEEHEHGGGHSGAGNGYGQYVKMAGDFLKKH